MSRHVTVLIVDDDALVRAGLRTILGSDPILDVVAEAADGAQAVDAARVHRPDVTLMDIRMPRTDGLEATAELNRAGVHTAVVVLTTFGENDHLTRAIELGVSGFLLKTGDPFELIRGIKAAAAGGACLSPAIARQLVTRLRSTERGQTAARTAVNNLSPREQQVARLLARGMSNAEIARDLGLVEGTVKGHIGSILTRLGVRNRVEAAVLIHDGLRECDA